MYFDNLISGPSPFLNPGLDLVLNLNADCTSAGSQFTNYWKLAWRILSITLLAYEMSVIVW